MVEVIYIATDDYSKYFEGFAETIKYFLPGVPKIVRVLSNIEMDYSIDCEDVQRVEFIKIFDLFYPETYHRGASQRCAGAFCSFCLVLFVGKGEATGNVVIAGWFA